MTTWAALVVPEFWLPNVRLALSRLMTAPVPLPSRETVCGLPGALSDTESVEFRLPILVGVNVTTMAQFWPAGNEEGQLFV